MTLSESFTGTTAPGWTLSGTGYTPNLTANNVDSGKLGWLRLTGTGNDQATYALNNTSFASANATVYASFDFASWGGSGADGITFFLKDSSVPFDVGAAGGSLGYAQKPGINGMTGGYIGIGLDEFGNYSNPTEARIGGIGFAPDAIAVRGPWNPNDRTLGYNYLGGSGTLSQGIDIPNTNGLTTRPASVSTTQYRHVELVLTPNNQLTVSLTVGFGNAPATVLTMDLSGYARPENLQLGFTASTGGSTNIHEVRNVAESSVMAYVWNHLGGNSDWSTAGNWAANKAPSAFSDYFLGSQYVSTPQTVNMDTAAVVRSLYFDGANAYTLSGANGITFNQGSAPGESLIQIAATSGTAASHTIAVPVTLANSMRIVNPTSATLNISGAVDLGSSSAIVLKNEGPTSIAGVISNAGRIINTGTLSLSNSNTFSGGVTNTGTLNISNNAALGTGPLSLSGALNGSTNTIPNITTINGNSTISNTSLSAVTMVSGSYNVNLNNVNFATLSLSSSTANTVTLTTTGNNNVINGVISNGSVASNLVKDGTGTLLLKSANTYTGTTTINGGTLQFGISNALNANSNLVLNGGTLALDGYSSQINDLNLQTSSALDFGTGTNSFLFKTVLTSPSGVLTLNNFTSGTDYFAVKTTNSGSTGVTGLLTSLYFSGIGPGAVLSGTTINANGDTWTPIIPTSANTGRVWSGNTNSNWSNTGNWFGGNVPNSNTELAIFDGAGTRAAVTLDVNETVLGVKFDTNATLAYNITGANTLTLDAAVANGIAYIQQKSAVGQTIGTAVSLRNSTVLDVTGAGNLTMSGAISATNTGYTLTKAGNGTLVLSGNSSALTNNIYLTAGTTVTSSTNALGTGLTTIYDGATLNLTNNITPTGSFHIAGTGYSSQGVITSTQGTNSIGGTVTFDDNSTINVTSGQLTISGAITSNNYSLTSTVANGANLLLTNTGNTLNTVNKYGAGTGTLALGSTSVNTANVYGGILTLGSGTAETVSTLNVAGGTFSLTGAVTASNATMTSGIIDSNNRALTFGTISTSSGTELKTSGGVTINGSGTSSLAGNLTGAGTLNVTGTGVTYISAANTGYTGTVNDSGTINVSTGSGLGSGTVNVASGGSIQLQGNISVANTMSVVGNGTGSGAINNVSGSNTLSGNVTLSGATTINNSGTALTLSTVTAGANNLNVTGTGGTTLGLTNASGSLTKTGSGSLTLNGSNFSGTINVNGGSLLAGASTILANTAVLNLGISGTLAVNNYALSAASIGGTGTLDLGSSGSLKLYGTSTFGGSITGTGTLELAANASLSFTSSISDPNLNLTLNAGSTLYLNGTNFNMNNLRISGSSTIDFGAGASSITINNITFDSTGLILSVKNWTDLSDYFFSKTNTGARGQAPDNQIAFVNIGNGSPNNTAWISYDATKGQITPVPEPATTGLLITGSSLGLFGLIRAGNRYRSKRKVSTSV